MSDDPAVIRAVLREHGIDVPARGRLSDEHRAEYERIVTGDGQPRGDAGYVEGEPPEGMAERKPGRARGRSRFGRGGGGGGQRRQPRAPRRPKHDRVPVTRLVERGWEVMARLAQPVDLPLARTLNMQAPVAGLVLEDVIAGTVVDRLVQPVARAEEKAEKVLALVGPPVLVLAIESAQGLPERQRETRLAFLLPALRESLIMWTDIADDKIEERARREEEMGPVYERIDKLIATIFAPPVPAVPDEPATAGAAADGYAAQPA